MKEGKRLQSIYETFSGEETAELGRNLGLRARAGDVYTLQGELGVGKTVFTQGMALGLSVKEPVNSPTFTIVQVYDSGRLTFYHF
ncbi:MAG: tRNA (adenosine(37)-N6)-threonylcarbamoyltransferase complex ATPase subunit type 1 TsaE, partial [Lachnospiraceae bacterium]|nr:tRNA (adenosine(37)-N6)-threonylcarbamoyltransferase complex ATPase subunit type 1 TsaE [Lachnospiraceae bacterium]